MADPVVRMPPRNSPGRTSADLQESLRALAPRDSVLVVSWGTHRRLVSICSELGLRLHALDTRMKGLTRWAILGARTLRLILRTRPRVVVAQNPSLVLALLVVTLGRLLRFHSVIDAHNEAVRPVVNPGAVVRFVARFLLRRASATIVTNPVLARDVAAVGGRPLVLFDPIPHPPTGPWFVEREQRTAASFRDVVVISTFAPDEPLDEIVEAARTCTDVHFAITGRAPAGWTRRPLPPNVRLTGYLSEEDYWALLADSDLVLDISTMPACLVCGAYEALAVGRPLLLADDEVNRELFRGAAVLSGPTSGEISAALREAIEKRVGLTAGAAACRARLEQEWQHAAAELIRLLAVMVRAR